MTFVGDNFHAVILQILVYFVRFRTYFTTTRHCSQKICYLPTVAIYKRKYVKLFNILKQFLYIFYYIFAFNFLGCISHYIFYIIIITFKQTFMEWSKTINIEKLCVKIFFSIKINANFFTASSQQMKALVRRGDTARDLLEVLRVAVEIPF